MPLASFQLFSPDDFIAYIRRTSFSRKITTLQNHHTWVPNYGHFKSDNYIPLLESMRYNHVYNRKWKDIGQHLTIFPDGIIGTGRPLSVTPAGILGANVGAICMEHLGNFDKGGDQMTQEQQRSIIQINAILCIKFGLNPSPNTVVYHHWYNTSGVRFSEERINSGYVAQNSLQKSCPGSSFFGGNTIDAAIQNFYPHITEEIKALNALAGTLPAPERKKVRATVLNVRKGNGTQFAIIRKIYQGSEVEVYLKSGSWSKINANTEEWVASEHLI